MILRLSTAGEGDSYWLPILGWRICSCLDWYFHGITKNSPLSSKHAAAQSLRQDNLGLIHQSNHTGSLASRHAHSYSCTNVFWRSFGAGLSKFVWWCICLMFSMVILTDDLKKSFKVGEPCCNNPNANLCEAEKSTHPHKPFTCDILRHSIAALRSCMII